MRVNMETIILEPHSDAPALIPTGAQVAPGELPPMRVVTLRVFCIEALNHDEIDLSTGRLVPVSNEEKYRRGKLANSLRAARSISVIDLTAEEVVTIKRLSAQVWKAGIMSQGYDALETSPEDQLEKGQK